MDIFYHFILYRQYTCPISGSKVIYLLVPNVLSVIKPVGACSDYRTGGVSGAKPWLVYFLIHVLAYPCAVRACSTCNIQPPHGNC